MRQAKWIYGGVTLLLATLFLPSLGKPQEPEPLIGQAFKNQEFWDTSENAPAAAAAQVISERNPLTILVLRLRGFQTKAWREPEFILHRAPQLSDKWLDHIMDGTPMPNLVGKAPDQVSLSQKAALEIFNEAVWDGLLTPLDAFHESAEDNKHVTFGHLWTQPAFYRGKVIPVEGRLTRLRMFDYVPSDLISKGVSKIYEGWIFGETKKAHPYCVIFPVPAIDFRSKTGILQPSEKMDRRVSFSGYFIKKYKYRAANGQDLEAPLLIGRTIELKDPEKKEGDLQAVNPVSTDIFYTLAGFVVFIGALMIGLAWIFRKGDRQFQEKLTKLQQNRIEQMLEREATTGLETDNEDEAKTLDDMIVPPKLRDESTEFRGK